MHKSEFFGQIVASFFLSFLFPLFSLFCYDLLLGELWVQEFPRKASTGQEILEGIFFTQICKHFHPYFRRIWPNHCGVGIIGNIFVLLYNFSTSVAKLGQRWRCQKWNKGQCSSQPVTRRNYFAITICINTVKFQK